MLNAIVASAIRFRGIVIIFAIFIVGYGLYISTQASLDVFPDFVPPQVTIQTEAPGLSPEQVETLVTFPIESAINGIVSLETTRSESIQGLSVIDVVFKEGSNPLAGRQLLSERLIEIGASLPTEVKSPSMSPMVSSTMDLLKIGLTSSTVSPRDLRSMADWIVRPLLKAVPGVAEVTVVGGEVEELQIHPDPDKMVLLGISFTELVAAASEATGIRGSGFVETHNQRLTIHTLAPTPTPDQIAEIPIRGKNGDAILLGDVATVEMGSMPKFGDALINGTPGVLLAMTSQYGANTLTTTYAVESALATIRPVLESKGVELWGGLHRPANFIEIALEHLTQSLLLGGFFVAIVLLLFLLDLRTAFISFISIPLSLLSAIIVMKTMGITLNTMTLGGLAVAVGVVVDDAIIDVENIIRRLRENALLVEPQPVANVVLQASLEVRGAVLYATLIVLAVFIPVFALTGLQGRFFAPLGIAFILAVLVSLLTALTVVPALCITLLGRLREHREPFYIRWMKAMHGKLLAVFCRFPILTGGVGFLLMGFSFLLVLTIPTELLPPFREGHFVLQAVGMPGSSLSETMRFGKSLSDQLMKIPEVASVEMQAGRSEKGVDTWGPDRCEFHVELIKDTNLDEAEIQEQIRKLMESYENMQTETLTFLGDRISESLSGETASVVISIYGNDLEALDDTASQIVSVLNTIEGATEVQSLGTGRSPTIKVELDAEKLASEGLRPTFVMEAVQTAFQGVEVAQIYKGNRVIPVTVRLPVVFNSRLNEVESLLLPTPTGSLVQLGDLGRVFLADARASISHESGRRRQVVTSNVSGRSVAEFVHILRKKIDADVTMGNGVYLEYSGAAEAEASTHRELFVATAVTLLFIGVFLSLIFPRVRNLILVLVNLPFAIAGGIVAVFLSGLPMSLGVLVGFITLLGLSMRNSIMLMTHYDHLVRKENRDWGLHTVLCGARERVVPVVMTAAVTGLAIVPLALNPSSAGREIEGPMAVVILGGLVSTTLVTLFILPAMVHRFGDFRDQMDGSTS